MLPHLRIRLFLWSQNHKDFHFTKALMQKLWDLPTHFQFFCYPSFFFYKLECYFFCHKWTVWVALFQHNQCWSVINKSEGHCHVCALQKWSLQPFFSHWKKNSCCFQHIKGNGESIDLQSFNIWPECHTQCIPIFMHLLNKLTYVLKMKRVKTYSFYCSNCIELCIHGFGMINRLTNNILHMSSQIYVIKINMFKNKNQKKKSI